MSLFNSKNGELFSKIFTALFVFAWFFCSAHISFYPDIPEVNSVPDAHQQSPTSHAEGPTSVCVDHSPTQHVSRYSNDISNTPVLLSNASSDIADNAQKVGILNADLIRENHISMRYSFLIYNKFLI